MSPTAVLASGVLEAIAVTCVRCWKEDHRPPPASALVLMEDYRWEVSYQARLESDAVQIAINDGYRGTANDLQHAAHREMYARSGDDVHLTRMMRHVT